MKAKQVQLVKAIFVPSGHTLPRTIADTMQSCPGIEMDLGPLGVTVNYKGYLFIIPSHMVECVVMVNEGVSSAKEPKKASK